MFAVVPVPAFLTACSTSRPMLSRSSSSTSFTTPRRRTYRRLLDRLDPGTARADRDARTGRRRRRPVVLRRPDGRGAAVVGRAGRGPAVPVPLLRDRRRHRPVAAIQWARGRYDLDALSNVFTGNDARATIVLRQLRDKVADRPDAGAGVLRERCARRVHGRGSSTRPACPPRGDRSRPVERTGRRRCGICGSGASTSCSPSTCSTRVSTCPSVDTVLFLRPTESATVFLQQLGRGLRRAPTSRC